MGIDAHNILDNCSKRIFKQCVDYLNAECDYFYCDLFAIDKVLTNVKLNHDIVLIAVRDHFYSQPHGEEEFTKIDELTYVERILYKVIKANPTKLFVIFNDHYNAEECQLNKLSNVEFILLGSMLDDKDNYVALDTQLDKNFSSTKIGISLNRLSRPHRLVLLSYLYGTSLHEDVYTTLVLDYNLHCNSLLDVVDWDFSDNTEFKTIIARGFDCISKNPNTLFNNTDPYPTVKNTQQVVVFNNAENFDNNLRKLYKESFVEIINETLYSTTLGLVTEKYLNSVYGENFPIFISTPNSVQHVRDIGFDVFDDIIDHSYDSILNPINRMKVAIESNKHLIVNSKSTIALWKTVSNDGRFLSNKLFAQTKMYNVIEDEFYSKFKSIINDYRN